MIYRNLPVCFHPTTLMMLDDDKSFVEAMMALVSLSMKFKPFTVPQEALEFLNSYERHPFTELCISQSQTGFEDRDIKVDITRIHEHMKNPDRENEIACVIVDFAMPNLTGSEFCEKIKDLPLKKLMLTGEATNEEGIRAFNANIIDQFYTKGAATIGEDIMRHVRELQIAYFQDLSSVIIKSLADSPNPPPHSVLDSDLVNPIFALLAEKNIAEYYLFSNEGYFKTVDQEGKQGWMVIHSDDEIDTLEDLISHMYSDTPSPALKKVWDDLKAREITLLFPTTKDSNKAPEDWGPYILQTQKISTPKSDYYIAFA